MIKFEVTASNQHVKDAFLNFLTNYKDTISEYLNTVIANQGQPADAGVEVGDDGNVTLFQIAPDKGLIIAESPDAATPLAIVRYKELAVGSKYLMPKGERIGLFMKTAEGEQDPYFGTFKNLNDVVKGLSSKEVADGIKQWNNYRAAKEKEAERTKKRLARLGMQNEAAEQETTDVAYTVVSSETSENEQTETK